ncbi:uncharacterized protein BDR25DRAFT_395026 [Lindgomyces ingoldianus]|uniref:Uncharacterized protein n=1 Tax=Lindgomyces ingoldianus TaxID=673940 RepID=A0ACB6QLN2_9PLEO|nr:uncharacterized protein BDR25DRAFT_395026 [Lindgomyces ingoldianus]KAF2467805.1 hypothetical protein BDR25DRAFT_395026 [Lindgomyces ingoldianus]
MVTSAILFPLFALHILTHAASPLTRRQSPYMTVKTETGLTWCRPYADEMDHELVDFYDSTPINITCWTTTTMPDSKGIVGGSKLWLWAANVTNSEKGGVLAKGVGTAQTTQYGCWISETYLIAGSADLKKDLKSCGQAPQHQVFFPKSNNGFTCHACTDLDKPACQRSWNATGGNTPITPGAAYVGYMSTGCWKDGTKVNGNSTWVKLRDEDCYISPDQPDQKEWHGNPAAKNPSIHGWSLETSPRKTLTVTIGPWAVSLPFYAPPSRSNFTSHHLEMLSWMSSLVFTKGL